MGSNLDLKCPECSKPGYKYPLVQKKKDIYFCKKCKGVFRLPGASGGGPLVKLFSFAVIFASVVGTDEIFLRSQGLASTQHLDIFTSYLIRFFVSFIFYLLFTKRIKRKKKSK